MANLTDTNGTQVIATCPACGCNYIRLPSAAGPRRCEVRSCGHYPLKTIAELAAEKAAEPADVI